MCIVSAFRQNQGSARLSPLHYSKDRTPASFPPLTTTPNGQVVMSTEPDESLVQALHKRGVTINRARRACVATRNASREAALAWCVEHASDPAMDAPFLPLRRLARGDSQRTPTGGAGNLDGDEPGERGAERRAAARAHRVAAAGLEAYVRTRLSGIPGVASGGAVVDSAVSGDNLGDGAAGVAAQEVEELVAVLTSFRQRQSLGEAEDRARALLPAGVDLGRFAGDLSYRQVCERRWCWLGIAVNRW